MRTVLILAITIAAGAFSGCDDADDGPGGAASCEDDQTLIAQCPPGSNPQLGSVAESMCAGAAGTIISDGQGAATGNCVGTSACVVACQWASPCLCGVASVTDEGIQCQPCDVDRGCGNGVCDPGENPEICAIDCGARCSPGEVRCGNEGGRQSCNLQGVWEDLACPDGRVCGQRDGAAECVLDVVGPNPEPEPAPGPDPEPGPDDNACWTFGPAEAPSDGAYLTPGHCRGLTVLGPARGVLSDDGQWMLRFDQTGLRRYPVGVVAPDNEAFRVARDACPPGQVVEINARVAALRDDEEPARAACALAALTDHCADGVGDMDAVFAAFDACAALPSPHLGAEAFGLIPEEWARETPTTLRSPGGRYALFRWKAWPRGRDDPWFLWVFDYRDQTFEPLDVPTGYSVEFIPVDQYSFAYEQRTLVAEVRLDAPVGQMERALAIWDLTTGAVRLALPGLPYGAPVQVSPDGRFVIFDEVFVDLETEEVFARFLCQNEGLGFGRSMGMARTGHVMGAWAYGEAEFELRRAQLGEGAYSPDGSTFIKVNGGDIELWDVEAGERIEVIPSAFGLPRPRDPLRVWPAPDCRALVVGGTLLGPAQ